jgi:radical SAM superfamily enzyme YgiQ (UPF0313 family)
MSLRPMDTQLKRLMSPSLALLVVAALTPPEHEVEYADDNVRSLPLHTDETPPDVVGISVNVDTSARAYAIAGHYRRLGASVVLGGIHASANPREAMQHADAVCIGEAEGTWPHILADFQAGRLQRLYRNQRPSDLSDTPLPRWDLARADDYLYTNIIASSRGCPFACEFCYNSCEYVHRRYRNRPVDNVLAEICAMRTRQVMFIDDNFIGDLARTRELLTAIRPLKLTWHAAVSTNLVHHPELMDLMRETGCRSLFIGFESINGASVASAGKKQNRVESYDRLVDGLHQRGIMVNASLVFGFDDDRLDVFDNTLDWLIAQRVETMTAHILTPYPGTRLHRRLADEGRILETDPTRYNTAHVVYRPRHMTPEQLREGYLRMYRRFYSLGSIARRMPVRHELRKSYLLFNLAYRKFGRVTAALGGMGFMRRIGRLARRLSYGID